MSHICYFSAECCEKPHAPNNALVIFSFNGNFLFVWLPIVKRWKCCFFSWNHSWNLLLAETCGCFVLLLIERSSLLCCMYCARYPIQMIIAVIAKAFPCFLWLSIQNKIRFCCDILYVIFDITYLSLPIYLHLNVSQQQ